MLVSTVVAALVAAAPLATARPAAADPNSDAVEAAFVEKINALRASKGAGPLTLDLRLIDAARGWAGTMAAKGTIFHQSDLSVMASGDWSLIGENVGMGGDVDGLFQAFVNSPGHYRNLVNPSFNRVGVGVVIVDGTIFTAHEFLALRASQPAARPTAQAPAPAAAAQPAVKPAPKAKAKPKARPKAKAKPKAKRHAPRRAPRRAARR